MSGSCASAQAATQTSFGQTTGQTGESSQDLLESLTLSAVKAYENVDWNTCKVPAAQDLINSRTSNTPSSFYQDYISKRGEDAGNDIPELDCVERLHQIEAKDNGDDLFNCETIYYLKNNEGAKFKLCPYCPIKWYNKLPFFDTVSNAYTHHMNGVHGILNSGNVAKQPAFGVVINTSTKKHSVCAVCPYDKKNDEPGSCSALIQLNVNNNVGTGSALKAYYRHVSKCHKPSSKPSDVGPGINHNEEVFISIEQLLSEDELDAQEQVVEPATPPAHWVPEVQQVEAEIQAYDFDIEEILDHFTPEGLGIDGIDLANITGLGDDFDQQLQTHIYNYMLATAPEHDQLPYQINNFIPATLPGDGNYYDVPELDDSQSNNNESIDTASTPESMYNMVRVEPINNVDDELDQLEWWANGAPHNQEVVIHQENEDVIIGPDTGFQLAIPILPTSNQAVSNSRQEQNIDNIDWVGFLNRDAIGFGMQDSDLDIMDRDVDMD